MTVPGEAPAATGRPARILVVDDDAVARLLQVAVLRRAGHEVEEASGGGEALDRLEREPRVDLVVLDLEMPLVGGRQVLAALGDQGRLPGLAVVIRTGTVLPDESRELRAAGARDVLDKADSMDRLVERVDALLDRG